MLKFDLLKFDLSSPPPRAAEIEAAKKGLLFGQKTLRLCMVILLAVAVLAPFIAMADGFAAAPPAMFMAAVALVMVFAFWVAERIDQTTATLAGLSPLSEAARKRGQEILWICREHEPCERYRLAVARLGRELTVAEADMMETWSAAQWVAEDAAMRLLQAGY